MIFTQVLNRARPQCAVRATGSLRLPLSLRPSLRLHPYIEISPAEIPHSLAGYFPERSEADEAGNTFRSAFSREIPLKA
jgi:hypothetical protein